MLNRNQYTKIEHFLSDESFRCWVRLKENHANWEEWTLESPERAKLVEEARQWLLAMKVKESSLTKQELDIALLYTWQKIHEAEKRRNAVSSLWQFWWFKAVAAIFIVTAFSLSNYLLQNYSINGVKTVVVQENDGLIEQTNNSNKPQLITLSDASSVLLQPKSTLSYPKIFNGKERKVYISGEGFFEISKNPDKPFLVYSNDIITKVYGTSFRVIAYPNKPNVEVLVHTGKVRVICNKVSQKTKHDEIMLLPNQSARYVRDEQVFEKILDINHDKTQLSSTFKIEQLNFDFIDTPVSQILKTIEQAYSITIDFPTEKLENCNLTTSLNDVPLPEKLKIICESLGNNTRYEMNGNHITIISTGCN